MQTYVETVDVPTLKNWYKEVKSQNREDIKRRVERWISESVLESLNSYLLLHNKIIDAIYKAKLGALSKRVYLLDLMRYIVELKREDTLRTMSLNFS